MTPYVHQPYPAWKYHRTENAVVVHSEEQEAALGEGWAHSPAVFAQDEPDAPAEDAPVASDAATEDAGSALSEETPGAPAPTKTKTKAPRKTAVR